MGYSVRTISYFTIWGLLYGVALGTFSGTAIFPYLGTVYSLLWGIGVGAACGLLSGVIAAVVRSRTFHRDVDLDQFRRRLSLGLGILNGIAAPALIIATTHGFLWGSGLYTDMRPWTALSLFAASFWGSLSSAYIASHYAHFIARLTAHREFDEGLLDVPHTEQEVYNTMRTLARAGSRWIFALGGIAGGLIYMASTASNLWYSGIGSNLIALLGYFVVGTLLGVIATFFFGLYVAFGNAAFLAFMKRVIFREYFSHLPPHWTRRILTASAFLFTLGTSVWTVIFAPIVAFMMAGLVYYTLARPDETLDKAKRKEKNALALDEETDMPAVYETETTLPDEGDAFHTVLPQTQQQNAQS